MGVRDLAAAMRRADEMGLPNRRGKMIERDLTEWQGEKPPCCAIGGAAIASGRVSVQIDDGRVVTSRRPSLRSFGVPITAAVTHPVSPHGRWTINLTITNLYDQHRWSRTRIANWLDELDPAEVDLPVEVEA